MKEKNNSKYTRFEGRANTYLVHTLNSRLTGWANYYRTVVSSKVFKKVNHEIVQSLMRWGYKRHARKGKERKTMDYEEVLHNL